MDKLIKLNRASIVTLLFADESDNSFAARVGLTVAKLWETSDKAYLDLNDYLKDVPNVPTCIIENLSDIDPKDIDEDDSIQDPISKGYKLILV